MVTTDKDGEGSELDRELADGAWGLCLARLVRSCLALSSLALQTTLNGDGAADVVISQPFYPAYITRQRLENSPNLKLAITAGIGCVVRQRARADNWLPVHRWFECRCSCATGALPVFPRLHLFPTFCRSDHVDLEAAADHKCAPPIWMPACLLACLSVCLAVEGGGVGGDDHFYHVILCSCAFHNNPVPSLFRSFAP